MVSGKSHSAEIPKESSMLAKRFVPSENCGMGFDRNDLEKKSHGKTAGLEKAKFGYSVVSKPNFKRKINLFEKTHNADMCKRELFGLSEKRYCCEISKK